MKQFLLFLLGLSCLGSALASSVLAYDFFADPGQWEAYDPGQGGFIGLGYEADGYSSAVLAGEYMYFIGEAEGVNEYHGDIVRFHITGDFSNQSDWEIFSPTDEGVGDHAEGFWGGVFDGRYIYFIPFIRDGVQRSGEIMRYDTTLDFDDVASWTTYDLQSIDVNIRGYIGGTFDGRYLYLSPYNLGGGAQGRYVRYDTQADFHTPGSWEIYQPGPENSQGAVFDGRYVYYSSGDNNDGLVVRFDTLGSFSDPGSWASYNMGHNSNLMTFDGVYVYFTTSYNGSGYSGRVYRYNTTQSFSSASSWEYFDAEAATNLTEDIRGYYAANFDGRYVYFAPERYNGAGVHSVVLKYDTYGDFQDENNWSEFSLIGNSIIDPANNETNWMDIGWDGVFMYFVPWAEVWTSFGEIVRFSPAKTTGAMYPRVELSNPGVNATNVQYDLTLRPLTPWADGSKVLLTFPDEYDTFLDTLTGADVSATGTHIASTSTVIDPVARQIQVMFTTTDSNAIVSDVTISIGDGTAGGLNDLTNPDTAGVYAVDIAILDAADSVFASSAFLVGIDNSLEATAHVVAAILLTLDKTSLQFSVDPATNNGEDLSQYNELTVSSNAGGGYVIYGGMRDANDQLQFAGSNGGAILPGLGENTMSYEAHNGAYDSGEAVDGTHTFQSTSGAALTEVLGGDLGYAGTTNQQLHTIYYDVNVDFLLPSGIYTGELVYTVIPTF